MKVKVEHGFFYPDVMVVCQQDNENEYFKNTPIIIVEVLSKSTRHFDQTNKRLRYQKIPSLEEYVLIEQDKGEIQVFSKKDHWQSFYYYLGDEITFSSLGVTVRVEDIYYQVNNEDVLDFLREKSA
jgi:Uma2 family endonuclease